MTAGGSGCGLTGEALRRQFAEKGWVRVPQAFARDAALEGQGAMWAQLERTRGLRQGQRSSWAAEEAATAPCGSDGLKDLKHSPVFRAVGSERLKGAIDDLLGAGAWTQPKSWGAFLVTFPGRVLGSPHAQPALWRVPRAGAGTGWHWDGNPGPDAQKAPAGEGRWPAVQVMTFFSDVEARGGGTLVSLLLLSVSATRLSYRCWRALVGSWSRARICWSRGSFAASVTTRRGP